MTKMVKKYRLMRPAIVAIDEGGFVILVIDDRVN
jgi:hypothetical protein